jgi:hypothetical protein
VVFLDESERHVHTPVVHQTWAPRGQRRSWSIHMAIEPTEDLAEVKSNVEEQEACFIATVCHGSSAAERWWCSGRSATRSCDAALPEGC